MRSANTLPPQAVGVSGPAPEIAPTDPQTPAGISEGSTKPLLQVQLGFLWNICQLSASHVWHLQYNASFKPRKSLKGTFFAQHTWSICIGKGAKPHFTVIPLTDQIFFSDLLGVLYHQQLQRLFFGNKILVTELLEAQSPVSGCVCIHVYL